MKYGLIVGLLTLLIGTLTADAAMVARGPRGGVAVRGYRGAAVVGPRGGVAVRGYGGYGACGYGGCGHARRVARRVYRRNYVYPYAYHHPYHY